MVEDIDQFEETLKWLAGKPGEMSLSEGLRWLAEQTRIRAVGQAPQGASEWREALRQVLNRVWLERRSQLESPEVASAALLIWVQYVEAGLHDAPVLSREQAIAALQDADRVQAASGIRASSLVTQIGGVAGAWRSQAGRVLPGPFRAAQKAGLRWWLDQIEDEYVQQYSRASEALRPADTVERLDLMWAVREAAKRCRGAGYPVILQGAPGVGKTTLLKWIASDPVLRAEFPDMPCRVITLGPKVTREGALRLLHKLLLPGLQQTVDDAALVQHLQQIAAGRRIMFLLDECYTVEQVRAFLECVAPESVVIVATREASLARELLPENEQPISVPDFTWEEAERYYQQVCKRPLDESARRNLYELWQLVHGNPLGLHIALQHVAQYGWALTLQRLQTPPLPLPAGMTDEVYKPVVLAYQYLASEMQLLFRRLGVMPWLRAYDLAALAALWQVLPAQAIVPVDRLCAVGLMEPVAGEQDAWQIHQQAWLYATSLLAQAPPEERTAAQQWERRALQMQEQREQYARLKQAARWPGYRALGQRRQVTNPFITESFVRRGLRRLYRPTLVSDWDALQSLLPMFTSQDYLLGLRLRDEEVRANWMGIGLVALIFAFLWVGAVARLVAPGWGDLVVGAVWLILWGLYAADLLVWSRYREVLWLELWERVLKRKASAVDSLPTLFCQKPERDI